MSQNVDTSEEMLEELRKIREAVEPKPEPPAPEPEGFLDELRQFIGKHGVMGMAVAFIIGLYVGKVVSALVTDIIMPIPGAFVPGGGWREATVTLDIANGMTFAIGDFVGVVIDFLIVVVVVFFIVYYTQRMGIK
jgi:large conductance mechanosensitive channel